MKLFSFVSEERPGTIRIDRVASARPREIGHYNLQWGMLHSARHLEFCGAWQYRWCRGREVDRTSAGSLRVVGSGLTDLMTCSPLRSLLPEHYCNVRVRAALPGKYESASFVYFPGWSGSGV